ncbi:MAG: hypothetical protein JWR52_1770 [Marmoricola sp.]|nr:hypothetical protein [Marmoricola sp.]
MGTLQIVATGFVSVDRCRARFVVVRYEVRGLCADLGLVGREYARSIDARRGTTRLLSGNGRQGVFADQIQYDAAPKP